MTPDQEINEPMSLDGASLLVTGGTGSFGTAFVRYVLARWKPRRLIVFSRDELKQYEMQQVWGTATHPAMRYFIGDVRDQQRLVMAMRGVDYVVHAAALKHVPTAEYNPFECLHTNVFGAENVVQAAIQTNVRRVVALSTDKAASPVNLYGASKLAADKIFVAANNLSGANGTRFSVVRYGNVLGSRGSVVPHFEKLLRAGAKRLPITDPRMTRFWLTLPRGVEFVLASLHAMQGGEIFVPKIPSMRVIDVARALAPDVEFDVVGIRPGEKLHETLITEDEARTVFEYRQKFAIFPPASQWATAFDHGGGTPVAEGFSYRSDTNPDWLDRPAFLRLLGS